MSTSGHPAAYYCNEIYDIFRPFGSIVLVFLVESSQIGCLTVEVCFGCCLPLLSIETPRKKLLTKGADRFMGLKLCESKNSGILQAK